VRRIVLALALYGCVDSSGLAKGSDSPEGGTDAGDAAVSSSDGGTEAATDAGNPTPGNLLINGDYELGCAKWEVSFGFISEATTIHNGKASCKFCMDTNWEAFLSQTVKVPVSAGESYYGEVFVKPAGMVADLTTAGYVGGNLIVDNQAQEDKGTDAPPLLDNKWQRTTTLYTVTKPYDEIGLTIRLQQSGNPAANGNVICVYVDDAVLRRQ